MHISSFERCPLQFESRSRKPLIGLIALLSGALAVSGCVTLGRPIIHERLVPGLECGGKKSDPVSITFEGMKPGDEALVGHPVFLEYEKVTEADATVEVDTSGRLVVTEEERAKTNRHEVEIENPSNRSAVITTEGQQYTVTVTPFTGQAGTYDIRIQGKCVK